MKNATIPEMRAGVRIHAIVFALTMLVLVIVNLWTGAPYWVLWILLGWGSGLVIHWWAVSRHITKASAA